MWGEREREGEKHSLKKAKKRQYSRSKRHFLLLVWIEREREREANMLTFHFMSSKDVRQRANNLHKKKAVCKFTFLFASFPKIQLKQGQQLQLSSLQIIIETE